MINFNELLATDLSIYLADNAVWFIDSDGLVDQQSLKDAINEYFKQHEDPVPALLRKK